MNIAVVILNYNGVALLKKFLPSVILNSKNEATIYVIDNGSSDNSVDFLKTHYSDSVSIIALDSNHGFAGGYNLGLQKVNEEIYCLLNSDVEVTENWLTPISKAFSENKNLGIAQPKILNQIHKAQFDYAGAAGGFIDKYGYPYCRGRIFETIEKDKGQYDANQSIFWASGACFFIRKDLHKKLNGFDEDFFAHMEEIDLCWRAQNEGANIEYFSDATVYHVGGATLDYGSSKKTFLNFRNSLLMLLKNLPKGKVWSIIFFRLILDGIAALRFLIKFQPQHFFAILKAHFSFYRLFKPTLKKRMNVKPEAKYYTIRSIVWSYYVSRIKTFDSL
ncbi:MAG: glycosyltransferase family 2 protein [bacterium]